MPKKSKKELKAEAEVAAAAKIAAAAARRQKLGLAEDATDAECAAAEEFAEIAASITDLPTLAKAAGKPSLVCQCCYFDYRPII